MIHSAESAYAVALWIVRSQTAHICSVSGTWILLFSLWKVTAVILENLVIEMVFKYMPQIHGNIWGLLIANLIFYELWEVGKCIFSALQIHIHICAFWVSICWDVAITCFFVDINAPALRPIVSGSNPSNLIYRYKWVINIGTIWY